MIWADFSITTATMFMLWLGRNHDQSEMEEKLEACKSILDYVVN